MSSIASVKQSRHTSIVVMPSLRMTSLNAGGFSQGRPCSVEPQQVEFSFCNIVGISNVESMEKLRRCQSRNLEIKSNFPQQVRRKEGVSIWHLRGNRNPAPHNEETECPNLATRL